MKSKCPLIEKITEASSKVHEKSVQQYAKLLDAYESICSVISKLVVQGGIEPILSPTENISKRLSLTAVLMQSSTIVWDLTLSGYYIVSISAMRHYMEVLARIIELRKGSNVSSKKTPNVSVLPFKLSNNYGRLSEICHTANNEYLARFVESSEDNEVASVLPAFSSEWSFSLLSLHIAHMITLAIEIHELQSELYSDMILENITPTLLDVGQKLVEVGFWETINENPV